jgi:hypothetical protein
MGPVANLHAQSPDFTNAHLYLHSPFRDKKGAGTDSKFFASRGKGENHELREELRSPQRDRKRDAVKKVRAESTHIAMQHSNVSSPYTRIPSIQVIANMTIGKDVSSLFTDVINCIQTDNLELKKLVYLYLINYAKSQPDLALLAVNTFVKDANDPVSMTSYVCMHVCMHVCQYVFVSGFFTQFLSPILRSRHHHHTRILPSPSHLAYRISHMT